MSYLIRTYIRADVHVQAHIIKHNCIDEQIHQEKYIKFFVPPALLEKLTL